MLLITSYCIAALMIAVQINKKSFIGAVLFLVGAILLFVGLER